jgi:4'-phosphopantetheinyl transferase
VRVTTGASWAPGPQRPLLAGGAVHVWRAELTSLASDLGELLCEEERDRAERILNKQEGELWRRSRGLLRELLGRYLGLEPTSLRFVLGAHGKPALAQAGAAALNSLPFNMSHSGELALYAFSDAGAVGVDVEVVRRPVNEVAIAARMLGANEAQRLQALDQPSRQREFLRAWTRHEAELKCLGVGIGEAKAERTGGETWAVELELGPTAGAAVATERRASELLCWDWPT